MHRILLAGSCLVALAGRAVGSQGPLPAPTGALGIGRVTVHWTDTTRGEPLSTDRLHREVMVDIWYPAERPAGPSAPYLDAATFEQALGMEGLRSLLGGRATDRVKAGRVQTHAVEGAPFARSVGGSPVLTFSARRKYACQPPK